MSELSEPAAIEDLYAYWGETPPASRPLMQGDVFSGVVLPGLGEEPQLAQLVMHPCQMRQGPNLRPRISLVPLKASPQRIVSADWRKSIRIMPLPELHGPGTASYKADLCEPSPVPSAALDPAMRLASLSDDGVLLLQQRLVMGATRVHLSLDRFHEQMAPTFTEMELQEEWAEAALASGSALEDAIKEFHAWLDEGAPTRRASLATVREHSRIRREARSAITARYRP
ncbi:MULTISPECIES: hypothetical protein [Streptomyces]|uniref:hypothetical protein n=1 Tax=Streptomyces TaxID=1883 RepID=UPI0004C1D03C|nr:MULTISPECIES: hypothetical protein [Streptomyces]